VRGRAAHRAGGAPAVEPPRRARGSRGGGRMRQVVQDFGTGEVRLVDVAAPAPRDRFVRVRTVASVVSPGTERAILSLARKSLVGKARARPDLVRRVVRKLRRDGLLAAVRTVRDRLDAPVALGYSASGVVLDAPGCGGRFVPGDAVACAGAGWANHADENVVPRNLVARVPQGVSLEDAAFGTLGAIALNAHRASGVSLGDRVAVLGVGLLGTLAVRIARAAGARVLAVDLDAERLARARSDGAEVAVAPSDAVAAARGFTGRAGVDAVVIAAATKDDAPVALAGELVRRAGTIVALGDVPLTLPRRAYYAKEATLRVATSYGPGRYDPRYEEAGRDYPAAYVRWTAGRNLEAFLALLAARSVRVDDLAEPVPLEEAVATYERLLAGGSARATRFVYPGARAGEPAPRARPPSRRRDRRDGLRTALIGAGAFGRGVLWPALRAAGFSPRRVVTATGPSAAETARRLGFQASGTSADEALDDDEVDVVVIATPHDSHADLASRALRAGKHVFVEKPLARDEEELATLESAVADSPAILTVGLNRRFSPCARRVLEFLAGATGPAVVTYRVNAGLAPDAGWLSDPDRSGGRLVGEACHMIDLACALTGERPVRVAAAGARSPEAAGAHDDVALTLALSGGSLVSLTYHAVGDAASSKERVEIARGDRSAVIDDFRGLVLSRDGKAVRTRLPADKGHAEEARAFARAIRSAGPPPIDPGDLFRVSRTTFAAVRSLESGRFEDV